MQYQASLVREGESLLSCHSSNQQHVVAWVLSRLEQTDYCDAVGVVRDQFNPHAPLRVYTHNPHFG